jgi:hypothetical protein
MRCGPSGGLEGSASVAQWSQAHETLVSAAVPRPNWCRAWRALPGRGVARGEGPTLLCVFAPGVVEEGAGFVRGGGFDHRQKGFGLLRGGTRIWAPVMLSAI